MRLKKEKDKVILDARKTNPRKIDAVLQFLNDSIYKLHRQKRDNAAAINKLAAEQRKVKDQLSELIKLRRVYKEGKK